ncbi:MAG: twin-arginine translocase subunit TatC [Actinomycetota bacterium]
MTLIEHLEELRARLFKIVIAFAVGATGCWFLYDPILAFLVGPLERLPVAEEILRRGQLIVTSPAEAFFVRLKVVSFSALVVALPVVLWQLWRFVAPGLYSHEKRYAVPFVVVAMALFGVGVALAFATLPTALVFLNAFAGSRVVLFPRATEYLSFVLLLVGAFGVTFEFPLILLALSLVGVLSSAKLRKGRRFAWILILIVAAVITPTADPITQLVLSIPLALLYEGTILAARLMKR